MKSISNKISFYLLSLPLLGFATKVFAGDPLDDLSVPVKTPKSTSVAGILQIAITWVLGFSAAVAVLFIIISGLQMITSAGNKERYETAKKNLTYAVLGTIIIVLAYAIVKFIIALPTNAKLTN